MSEIHDIINLVKVLSDLVKSLGIVNIIWLVILIYAIYMINKIIQDKKDRYYYENMLKEKNANIEQLADDNRKYRDIYLKELKNIRPDLYEEMSAEKIEM